MLLFIFLIHFIWEKIKNSPSRITFNVKNEKKLLSKVLFKTLAFTFLNPHVYSDTVFFLGNFSKNFILIDKYYFGIGAATSSFIFFFTIGYMSKYLSKYLKSQRVWKKINLFIIIFMSILALYILIEILSFN